MAIILSDNLKINAPKPVDDRYLNITIPWTGSTQVNAAIPIGDRYPGLTVDISGVEYWYQTSGDVTSGNLTIKDSGIANTGITTAINGLTKVGNAVRLGNTSTGSPLTGNTYINDSRAIPVGIQYGGDYSGTFTLESLASWRSVATVRPTGKTTNFTLSLPMLGEAIVVTSASGVTVTIPTDASVAFPIGSVVTIQQGGAGTVTAVGDIGVTVNGVVLSTTKQYAFVQYWKTAVNTWSVIGGAIEIWATSGTSLIVPVDDSKRVPIKYISGLTTALAVSITGATNGLTKYACHDVCLGGALTAPVTISGAQTLKINVSTLSLSGNTAFNLSTCCGLITTSDTKGLEYSTNYSGSFANNSLISKCYADGCDTKICGCAQTYADGCDTKWLGSATGFTQTCVSNCTITACNGLHKSGNVVLLGGLLTGDTSIVGAYEFDLNTNKVNITGATGGVNLGGSAVSLKNLVGGSNIVCINTSTGVLGTTSVTALGGITGGTNGLTNCGSNKLGLGGSLCADTVVQSGAGSHSLTFGDLAGISLITSGTTDIFINAESCGSVWLRSQSGTSTGCNMNGSVGIYADYDAPVGFQVFDNRVGANQTGIQYSGDYSLNYVPRSLVDKGYVDSVATGLNVHAAVVFATTSGITLSGVQIVDGYTTSNGDRILVKNQTLAPDNGIYVATGGTWQRAADYNFSPPYEIANGDLIPVTSGSTLGNTLWVLTTPNPIISGTSLNYSEFATVVDVIGGAGIAISQVGGTHTVCVALGSDSGLDTNNGLVITGSFAGSGLTLSSGVLSVNATSCASVPAVPVGINAGCCLVVACSDIITAVDAITGATNGLCETNHVVCLGGIITGTTTTLELASSGGALLFTDSRLAPASVGLQYTGNYDAYFTDLSLIDKCYVDTCVGNCTIGACNGLHKSGNVVLLGGLLTGGTTIDVNGHIFCICGASAAPFISIDDTNINCNILCLSSNGLTELGSTGGNGVCIKTTSGPVGIGVGTNLTIGFAGTGIVTDSSGNGLGLQYVAPYETTFGNASLVTKCYVDGCISAGAITAGCGICNNSNTFDLKITNTPTVGSYLNVKIDTTSHDALYIDSVDVATAIACASPSGTLISAYDYSGALVVQASDIQAAMSANTFTNGLTATAGAVCLGGALTHNTTIGNSTCALRINVDTLSLSGNTTFGLTYGAGTITNVGGTCGLKYAAYYGATNVAQSIPDAQWVTGLTHCANVISPFAVTGATNGLTKFDDHNVCLGGALSGNTCIGVGANKLCIWGTHICQTYDNTATDLYSIVVAGLGGNCFTMGSNTMCLSTSNTGLGVMGICADKLNIASAKAVFTDMAGTHSGITYASASYRNTFVDTSLVDKGYVLGQITGGTGIHDACNGLTKTVGGVVILGGALTGPVTIYGTQTLKINVSTLNLSGNTSVNITGTTVNIGGTVTLQKTPASGVPLADAVLVWNSSDKQIKTVSGAALGDKNNVYTKSTIVASTGLTTGSSYVILANSPSAAITITLPATPIDGEAFKIKDIGGQALVYNITVDAGAGKQIDNAQTGTINTDFGALEIMYNGATSKWYSLAFVN